ncbi:OB-fold domain-containing protein [Candidatus Daviesbacteria bacterium]|nr:OB-fold domain-containing protein [Candidatus Daviesbacteria bacterium]
MSSPVTVWRHHKNIKNYLNKKGKVLVWTRVFVAPAGYEQDAPYFVAMVQFEDGTKMPLQVVDFEGTELKRNQKIITVVRRLSKVKLDEVIEYGIKAKPV